MCISNAIKSNVRWNYKTCTARTIQNIVYFRDFNANRDVKEMRDKSRGHKQNRINKIQQIY